MWRTSSQDAPWPSCLPTSRRMWRHLPSLGDKERIPLREAPSQLQRLASTFQPPYIQPVLISAGLTPTVQARFSERPGFLFEQPKFVLSEIKLYLQRKRPCSLTISAAVSVGASIRRRCYSKRGTSDRTMRFPRGEETLRSRKCVRYFSAPQQSDCLQIFSLCLPRLIVYAAKFVTTVSAKASA